MITQNAYEKFPKEQGHLVIQLIFFKTLHIILTYAEIDTAFEKLYSSQDFQKNVESLLTILNSKVVEKILVQLKDCARLIPKLPTKSKAFTATLLKQIKLDSYGLKETLYEIIINDKFESLLNVSLREGLRIQLSSVNSEILNAPFIQNAIKNFASGETTLLETTTVLFKDESFKAAVFANPKSNLNQLLMITNQLDSYLLKQSNLQKTKE
jgi:hypothetical protein